MTRFRREAEAAANLRSPHTVELYDFGETEDQTLYFVMELLEGMDLETLVRLHGPVPAGRAVHILRQVCASLAEAHASGLVHRDIKPANIHVGRLGLVDDFVKVLDFGLVKPAADGPHEDSATQAGFVLGTPGYMAPEMALGDSIDGRTDLYALGCVAYYLLTGVRVFEGATTMQVMAQHLQAAPVPPSARVPRDSRRDGPAGSGLPGQAARGQARHRRGALAPAGGARRRAVDRRRRARLVGVGARAGGRPRRARPTVAPSRARSRRRPGSNGCATPASH